VSDYWTLSFDPQQCINETAHLLAGGIINTLTDFCVVLIPIPVVMRLRLPLRQRIYCALLFGAGFVICIAGSFRIAYTYQLNTTYDKTWLAYPAWIAGTVELYLGIVSIILNWRQRKRLTRQIATSIPAIKPFLSRYFPRVLSSNTSNHTSSGHLRSLEPHHDRNSSKSPLSNYSSTDFPNSKSPTTPFTSDVEKGLSFPHKSKSKALPLTPVISAFSTYKKPNSESRKSIRDKGISLPIAAWKNSNPLPSPFAANDSSKRSLSSFDLAWATDQQTSTGGLKAPKHARKESREVLVVKVESNVEDSENSDEK
jgi:hypothetical protein